MRENAEKIYLLGNFIGVGGVDHIEEIPNGNLIEIDSSNDENIKIRLKN